MRVPFLVGLVITFAGSSARAADIPLFRPTYTYWATHIVIVVTEPGGGRFRVIESWKGDLGNGTGLTIPGLAADAKGEMVLFLSRNQDPTTADFWKPAGIGDQWRYSVVWLDGDKVSAYQRMLSTQPPELSPYVHAPTRNEFKRMIGFYLENERAFAAARALKDTDARVAAFAKIVNGFYDRKSDAFEELGKCGPKALPVLRAHLKERNDYDSAHAITAIAAAGGRDVVPELHQMLKAELEYWKQVGPTLKKYWWTENGTDNEPARRSGRLRLLIDVYASYPNPDYRATIIAVRDYLRTVPAIDQDKGTLNMSDYCDRVLKKGDR
jgi:hypothetical protein